MRMKGKAETSIKAYRAICAEFTRTLGKSPEYGPGHVDEFMNVLMKKEKTKGHLDEQYMKGSYLRFVHYALKALYKANGWEWYDEDDEELPTLNEPRELWYTYPEMVKLLDAVKEYGPPRDYVAFRLLEFAFSRRRAWIMLKRWDYNAEEGTIKMPSIKHGRAITIKLDPTTNEAMLQYLASRTDVYAALFPSYRPRNPEGQARPEYVNRLLKKYAELAGIENKGMHAIRRGMATFLHSPEGGSHSETEIWKMGDWKDKDMVSRYIQLGPNYATEGREASHPFFREQRESKRQPVIEGPEESPRERRIRLGRPTQKDLSAPRVVEKRTEDLTDAEWEALEE